MAYVCVSDFEDKAQTVIQKNALDYYKSGAGDETSLNLNCKAFQKLRIRPRFLRDVSHLNTSCNILNTELKWPVGIAPTAMQKMAHPKGEIASACAAETHGSIFILSTLSTSSVENVAAAAPNTCKWFQLYVYKDRTITEKLLRRVEKAGFNAVVLTVDAPVFGQRLSDIRNKFELPSHLCLANFEGLLATGVHSNSGTSGINEYVMNQFDPTLSWKDVSWLIQNTKLPVVLKGILTAEDAILAQSIGCVGIIVSNHGGRQLDSVPASIEALPEIVNAVGKDLTIMMDGGIRSGGDIFKSLALGAKYVFVGRPALWGLACDGQQGVENMLSVLKRDFEITLALSGCKRLCDINKNMVVHENFFAKM